VVRGAASPVWVGRERELARLDEALERARAGEPQAVLVIGETGVGKTRLVGEFARRSGVRTLTGACLNFGAGTVPYLPLIEILRRLVREGGQEDVRLVLGPARADLARLLPELGRAAERPTEENEGLARARLFERVLGLAERLGRHEPVLLVIEDAHWMDASTRDLLSFLMRSLRSGQLMLVVTCRSDALPPGHPFLALAGELERAGVLERVELKRLDRAEVEAQMTGILGEAPSMDLVRRVTARSGGNPLFVEELLAAASSEPGNELPGRLRDVLLSRLSALSESSRSLVRLASTAGQRIDEPILVAVAGLEQEQLLSALREASDEQVLVATQHAGTDGYEFRHPLLQEVIYEALLPAERLRGHAAMARALTETGPGGFPAPDASAEIAHHWYAAREYGRALPAAVDAGLAAMHALAFAEAQRQLERALELWEKVPYPDDRVGVDHLSLVEHAAEASARVGDYKRGIELGRMALAQIDPEADPVRAAACHTRLRWFLWESGDHAAALADAQEAVRLVPSVPPNALRANVLGHLAGLLMFAGEHRQSMALAQEALSVARAADARTEEALALGILGLDMVRLGQIEPGLEQVRQALVIAHELKHITGIALAHAQLSGVLEALDRAEEAAEVAVAGIETARQLGLERTFGLQLRGNAASAMYALGRWDEAERLLRETSGLERMSSQGMLLLLTHIRISVARGHDETARDDLVRLKAVQEHAPSTDRDGRASVPTAELALWRARPAEARVAVDEGLALAGHGQLDVSQVALLLLGLRAEADLAELARARRDTEALGQAQARGGRHIRALRRRLNGVPAEVRNATAGAELAQAEAEYARLKSVDRPQRWNEAAGGWEENGRPYWAAYARWREGAALIAGRGGRAAAAIALSKAYAAAADLGARPLREAIEALAQRARIPLARLPLESEAVTDADPTPAAAPAESAARLGLTTREREVLGLLADGRTNREIASELFISPKTASVHVTNILAKLGVQRRVEAAGLAIRLGLVAPRSDR
jgi:DNA-binding CsgD family transcriptional regulator